MAQLPPVILPKNEWVDLYAATGITVGAQLRIHNNSDFEAYLSDSLTEPLPNYGFDRISADRFLTTVGTPSGVWARANREVTLQVEEVV